MQTKRDFTKDYSCNQNRRITEINKAVTWQTKGHVSKGLLFCHGSTVQRKHKILFSKCAWREEKKAHSLHANSMEEGNMEGENGCGGGGGGALLWGGGLVMMTLWLKFSQNASHGGECSESERTAEKAQQKQKKKSFSHTGVTNSPPSTAWKPNVLLVDALWWGLELR